MLIVSLLQDARWCHSCCSSGLALQFSPFEIIKMITCFLQFDFSLNHKQNMFFLFSIRNIKSNFYIIFLKVFAGIFSDGKCIPFQLYLFRKGLIFVVLCRSFLISSWFNVTVTAYWKDLWYFLLIGFIVPFFTQ